jgi:radical SAM protein with 4Fe4S-binding SPASM domain
MPSDGASVDAYKQILQSTARRHRLLSAQWELTYRCNEKCTHCYLDVFAPNAKVPGELSTEECFRVLDELAELGVLNLTLTGGEAFTRRDFFEIARYARQKRFLLRLFTNGILINERLADRIAELHPYAVELSLYGADAETHDGITLVRRSFELTVRAFRLLRERGIRTVMKTPLMHENVRQIHELEALADELGAQFRYDTTITPKDNGSLSPLMHRLTYDDLVWLLRETANVEAFKPSPGTPDQRTCGIALNALVIDPYGNVFPCVQTRMAAGNLRVQPLKTIWETSPVWTELGDLTLGNLPVCGTCELRTICTRCHGLALVEDGDLRGPAYVNCREALARRQVLIEKGALPPDYPIPPHLQNYPLDNKPPASSEALPAHFIPLEAIAPVHEPAAWRAPIPATV